MVTPDNLLEAAIAPLGLHISLKPIEVLLPCNIFKEFHKNNSKDFKSIQYQSCPQTRNDRWLNFKKT